MTFPEFLVICEPGTGLESSVRISAAHYSLLAVTHTLSQSLKGPAFPPQHTQISAHSAEDDLPAPPNEFIPSIYSFDSI